MLKQIISNARPKLNKKWWIIHVEMDYTVQNIKFITEKIMFFWTAYIF